MVLSYATGVLLSVLSVSHHGVDNDKGGGNRFQEPPLQRESSLSWSRSRRTVDEWEREGRCVPCSDPVALEDRLLGLSRPEAFQVRPPWLAALLGGGIGLGTGHYYGGRPHIGFFFSALDTVLWVGLGVALTKGRRTNRASGALAGALGLSHLSQALGAWSETARHNKIINNFAYVPLGGQVPKTSSVR